MSASDLLAELTTLQQRQMEITAELAGLPAGVLRADPVEVAPPDFDRQAYAIGIVWRNPAIPVRELAAKVGVNHQVFYQPQWADLGRVLRARPKSKASG